MKLPQIRHPLTFVVSGVFLALAMTSVVACTTVNVDKGLTDAATTVSSPSDAATSAPAPTDATTSTTNPAAQATETPTSTPESTETQTPEPTSTPKPTETQTPEPTSTETPADVTLADGTWTIKMVTSRGNSFYPTIAVNFKQYPDGTPSGELEGTPYTYSSGGTTLITQVTDGTVDSLGNVELDFTVHEGTAFRASFTFTGKAGPSTRPIRNQISGDPTPEANSGFERCTDGCGYEATFPDGSTETGFFTMSSQ